MIAAVAKSDRNTGALLMYGTVLRGTRIYLDDAAALIRGDELDIDQTRRTWCLVPRRFVYTTTMVSFTLSLIVGAGYTILSPGGLGTLDMFHNTRNECRFKPYGIDTDLLTL